MQNRVACQKILVTSLNSTVIISEWRYWYFLYVQLYLENGWMVAMVFDFKVLNNKTSTVVYFDMILILILTKLLILITLQSAKWPRPAFFSIFAKLLLNSYCRLSDLLFDCCQIFDSYTSWEILTEHLLIYFRLSI